MRELNFRIGRKLGNGFRYLDKDELFNLYRLNPYDGSLIVRDNGRNVVVPKETYVIEQYTGLKDKNGKEIYEGDIVEYSWDFCGEKRKNRYVVEWLSGKIEHYPYSVDSGFTLPDSVDGYMVVGNIHENQELIGRSI